MTNTSKQVKATIVSSTQLQQASPGNTCKRLLGVHTPQGKEISLCLISFGSGTTSKARNLASYLPHPKSLLTLHDAIYLVLLGSKVVLDHPVCILQKEDITFVKFPPIYEPL